MPWIITGMLMKMPANSIDTGNWAAGDRKRYNPRKTLAGELANRCIKKMVHSDKTWAAGEQKRIQSGTLQQESKIKKIDRYRM
jgi:hypothetical protein